MVNVTDNAYKGTLSSLRKDTSEMESIINEILFQISTKLSTIQGNNFILQLYTISILILEMSSTSYIEVGECEIILRQNYFILQTELLILNK